MKFYVKFFIFILMFSITCYSQNKGMKDKKWPVLKGPYLGQKPPGMKPEIFAPGIVSHQRSVHSATVFSNCGNEMYWTVMNDSKIEIVFMKKINGVWSKPRKVPFSGSGDDANPFFSSEGDRIYFKSTREDKNTIWFSQRADKGWSDPVNLGSPFSNGGLGWQASITKKGTIYFVRATANFESHDIYKAEYINGSYNLAIKLDSPLNSDISDWQVFVEPDEEYIIFGRWQKNDPSNQKGLYISFRKQNGKWIEPINMGNTINGEHGAYWPYVSPDKIYFFFVSDMENGNWHYDVYWVNAKIIEDLKPRELK